MEQELGGAGGEDAHTGPLAEGGGGRRGGNGCSERREGEGTGAFLVTNIGSTQAKRSEKNSGHSKARPHGGGG